MKNTPNEIYLYDRELKKKANYGVWLAFPGPESFALSSLGYMWLYKKIDEMPDVNVERIYSDTKKTAIMRSNINLIGFSFTFDMDFLQIFKMLENNNLKLKAEEREESDPIVFAGGPVITSNPEPYKEFFDFLIIGDGEEINTQVIDICKANKGKTKKQILELLYPMEGIYIPSLEPKIIKKVTHKLSECIYTPIIAQNAFFESTFIIEIERGCANRCGFCLASYLNLPIRFPKYEEIINKIDLGLKHAKKIALLGAQVTAHPKFKQICEYINTINKDGGNIELGVSSLRVDSFTKDIVSTLVNAGQKNLTLAIEAGSERLRKVINKNLSEKQIFNAIDVAVECGLHGIKFYGMLGLPTETNEDIDELINLAKKIKSKYKGFNISFGFSTFVPKANTPFQWIGRENEQTLKKKAEYLKKEMHKIGVKITVSSIKWDYYQALLSRGDAKLTNYLINVYNAGGKLGSFKNCAKQLGINTDYYASETYDFNKELPWDFIDTKPGKEFLITENKRLINN